MKFHHVVNYVATNAWAILPEKWDEILSVLTFKVGGGDFTPEELQARGFGDPKPAMPSKRGTVAVIPLRGMIAHRADTLMASSGGASTEQFVGMLRSAVADESVGTIVLDIDSPGGTVVGVPEAAQAVFEARESKRIIAVANSMMASAAYWIGAAAHEIVGHPSAFEPMIGSIGVYTVHKDLSAALDKQGIKLTVISAGKHKVEGSPGEPLSDETKQFIQGAVDTAYAAFTKDVARFRGVSVADVRGGFGEGRALSSKDAKAAGLIDRIATLEDVIGKLVGRSNGATLRADVDTPSAPEETPVPLVAADPVSNEIRQRLERF